MKNKKKFLILLIVTYAYNVFADNIYVARALVGVRAAVVPIIISAVLRLAAGTLPSSRRCCIAAERLNS